jgi:hypothetical protein
MRRASPFLAMDQPAAAKSTELQISSRLTSTLADPSPQAMEFMRELAALSARVDNRHTAIVRPSIVASTAGVRVVKCSFRHLAPLDGIISFLTRECGGNPHDRGAITVLASSASDRFSPRLLVDPDLGRRWC